MSATIRCFLSTVAIVQSCSTASPAYKPTYSAKDCTSEFHGSSIRSSMTFVHGPIKSARRLAQRVSTRASNLNAIRILTDLQMVNIGLRVLSRPDSAQLPRIYRTLGTNWEERVLPSICNEVRAHDVLPKCKFLGAQIGCGQIQRVATDHTTSTSVDIGSQTVDGTRTGFQHCAR